MTAATRELVAGSRLLTLREAADALRISTTTLRRIIRRGELTVVRVGAGAVRIRTVDLDAYVLGRLARVAPHRPDTTLEAGVVLAPGRRLWD